MTLSRHSGGGQAAFCEGKKNQAKAGRKKENRRRKRRSCLTRVISETYLPHGKAEKADSCFASDPYKLLTLIDCVLIQLVTSYAFSCTMPYAAF